jgi:hypothetical protein
MILFSQRMKIDYEFQDWCANTKAKYCIESFIIFIQSKAKNRYPESSKYKLIEGGKPIHDLEGVY